MLTIIKNILVRNWFGFLVALIILFFLFQECQDNRTKDDTISALNSKQKSYRNSIGTLTAQVKTVQLSEAALKNQVIKKNDTIAKLVKHFSSVKSIVTTKTTVEIPEIKIPFKVPVECSFVREDTIKHRWYSFGYCIDNNGFELNSLKIEPNTQIIATGLERKWILGRTTLITEVTNTNPYYKTNDTKSYQVLPKAKWYESKVATFVAGALTLKAIQQITK